MTVDSFPFLSKDQEDIYFMKGAFEEVIHHCSMYNNGGIPLPLTPQQKSYCQQEEKKMGSLGLRGWCRVLPPPSHWDLEIAWSVAGIHENAEHICGWQGRADSKAQCDTSQSRQTAQSQVTPADAGVACVLGVSFATFSRAYEVCAVN